MGFLQNSVRNNPSLADDIYDMLRIIMELNAVNASPTNFEALGLNTEEVRKFNIVQLLRKLTDVGIPLPDDLKTMIDTMVPEITGG